MKQNYFKLGKRFKFNIETNHECVSIKSNYLDNDYGTMMVVIQKDANLIQSTDSILVSSFSLISLNFN